MNWGERVVRLFGGRRSDRGDDDGPEPVEVPISRDDPQPPPPEDDEERRRRELWVDERPQLDVPWTFPPEEVPYTPDERPTGVGVVEEFVPPTAEPGPVATPGGPWTPDERPAVVGVVEEFVDLPRAAEPRAAASTQPSDADQDATVVAPEPEPEPG